MPLLSAPKRTRAREVGLAALATGFAWIALEVLAALLLPIAESTTYREHGLVIDVLGLPALNRVMSPHPTRFWSLRDGLRDERITERIRRHEIDFTVSAFDGYRGQAPREPRPALRVLAVGESCTFGLGVDDDETWPARLEERLAADGFDAEVINAGVPGYTAYQGRLYLEEQGYALEPDVVVVSFGFNDADEWASHSDAETAVALRGADGSPRRLLRHSNVFRALEWGWGEVLRNARTPAKEDTERVARPRLDPDEFRDALGAMLTGARERNALAVALIWPLLLR